MRFSPKIISFAVLLFCQISFGQEFTIQNFSIEDGLPQSQVLCGFQDKRGYLWFGTNGGGVAKFDGSSFNILTQQDGLSDIVITSISEDWQGNIWFGTLSGLNKFNGIEFTQYKDDYGFSQINNIFREKESLWIADNQNGLINYNGNVFKKITTDEGLISNRIFDLIIDSEGRMWVSSDIGVNLFSNDTIYNFTIDDGLLENYTTNIFEDKSNNIWFTHPSGLTKYESGKFYVFDESSGLQTDYVASIYQDAHGLIWVGCIENLYYFKNGKFKEFRTNNQSFPLSISTIFEDKEKNLWVTTDGDGVFRINGVNFSHLAQTDGLSSDIVWSINQDDYQNYWFATVDGLNSFNGNKFIVYSDQDGLPSNTVYSVTIDKTNSIWAATFLGLSKFSNGRFNNYDINSGLIADEVVYLFVDSQNKLWIATAKGLSIFSNGKFSNHPLNDDGIVTGIFHIYEDSNNDVWVCTEYNGVKVFKEDGSIKDFEFPAPFNDKQVWCMTQDERGSYWFGHWGRGLINYDPETGEFNNYSSKDGLINDNIASILYDDRGYIWLGTNRGASKFHLDDYYTRGEVFFRNYEKNDGFIGIECNQNAIYKDSDGNIWFGTNKGATKYDPYAGYDKINKIEPQTHFTGLKLFYINDEFSDYSDSTNTANGMPLNLELPYTQNHLTFDFIGLSFKNPEKVRYKYRMIGVDEDWSPAVKNNHATYTNLSPGEYTFEVIASNNDGIWNSTPTQYSFIILKPFWSQWWFAFLVASGLVTVVFTFVAYRTRTLQNQKEELERQVKLRTREVSEEKEKVELINKKLELTNADLERFIAELERTNNELEKLSIVARETDNSIFIADSKGELIWQNDCASRTTGYDLDELKSIRGKTLSEISFKADMAKIMEECRNNKKSIAYEVVNKTKGGAEYWSSSTLTPILDENENVDKFVIVETNINYIKKIEEQLRIAHDQLEQRVIERTAELSTTNQKLRKEIERRETLQKELIKAKETAEASDKLKSEFLAQMSHEIRTPISTVLNYSSLIREEMEGKLEGDLSYSFDAISRAGNRIFRTVDMILNMAEIQTGAYEYKPSEIDVYNDVLSELNSVYKNIAEKKKVDFNVNRKIDKAKIKGDLNSLTQIFTQLLDNAVKYTDEGKIEVNVEQDEDEHIIVNVLDTGIGISDDYLERLFEPFSQEEQGYTRKYDGNGLGLALVHRYCKMNNIEISVDSSKGRGTKVSLIFKN